MLTLIWSPVEGQAGSTTMLCLCGYYVAKKAGIGERVLLTRTRLKEPAICEIMDAQRFGVKVSAAKNAYDMTFEEATGNKNLDRLLMSYAAGFRLLELIENNSLSLGSKLYVLEGSKSKRRESYEKEMLGIIESFAKAATHSFEHVFLEAESGDTGLNEKLFELADRIIVCLPQNIFVLRQFNEYKMPWEKVRLVFSNYDETSVLNYKSLGRQLTAGLKPKYIPYLGSIKNAYSAGMLQKEFEELMSYGRNGLEKELEEILG